jgi:glycosyltransferase involved in cell wall biosynthesis
MQKAKTIRVLQVLPDLSGRYGGPVSSGLGLASALRRVNGIESKVFGVLRLGDEPTSNLDFGEIAVQSFWSDRSRMIGALKVAHEMLLLQDQLADKFDICLVHTLWNPVATLAAWVCRARGIPYVLSPHGMMNEVCLARHAYRKRVYSALVEAKTVAGAACVRFLNEHEAARSHPEWLSVGRYEIIPNGVDLIDVRGEFGFPETLRHRRVVLFVGRLHPIKRLDLQVEAMSRVMRRYRDVVWVLIGHNDGEWKKLESLAKRNGIEDRVSWLGSIHGNRRLKMMQEAEMVILTSDHEGQSMVVNESLSVGVPLVVTNSVNAAEVGRCGAGIVVAQDIVSIAEAIERVLEEKSVAAAMRTAGVRYAQANLSWDVVAVRFAQLFESILQGPASNSVPL